MRCFTKIIISLLLFSPLTSFGLPIGFGTNQGDLEYSRTENQYHLIYHDTRAPNEAAMIQNSLTAVRPVFEKWFGKQLESGLIVTSSAASENASFANFMSNSIELQTLGQGGRDLFWHEYTHTNMYRHFHNFFGPAGALFHLPWMPAWFIEGLAESMTVSTGSDIQISIERYQALTNTWPSFDRMHSLYHNASFFLRGYSTSGAFVSWILRQGDGQKLPMLLDDFYDYTMPWWWLWVAVPYNGFTPMNHALENYANYGAEELYSQYKNEATAYWKSQDNGVFLSKKSGARKKLNSLSGIHTFGNETYLFFRNDDEELFLYKAKFHKKTGWLTGSKVANIRLPDIVGSLSYATAGRRTFSVGFDRDMKSGFTTHKIIEKKLNDDDDDEWTDRIKRTGKIYGLYRGKNKLAWYEQEVETTRMCWVPLSNVEAKPNCILESTQPRSISILGAKNSQVSGQSYVTNEIWIVESEQTLKGDRYKIKIWNLDTNKISTRPYINGGRPISIAFAGKNKWLLVGSSRGRSLRKIDQKSRCLASMQIADLPLKISGLSDGSIVFSLYQGGKRTILKVPPADLKTESCYDIDGHISPLLYALNQEKVPNLAETLKAIDPWKPQLGTDTIQQNITDAAPLDKAPPPFAVNSSATAEDNQKTANSGTASADTNKAADASQSTPATWRGRPLFLFPFVGANDALGGQYGFVSVPLMDHLQNETLRVSILYGSESRFPSSDLTFTSTRYWPTLNFSGFRKQSWNGSFYHKGTSRYHSIYMDERGGKIDATFPFRFVRQGFSAKLGLKVSTLKRYLGPFLPKEGQLNEPSIGLSFYKKFDSFSWSTRLNSRFTLLEMNTNFDYNVLGGSTSISFRPGFLKSSMTTGVSGSRTRGKRPRALRETYSPLKTFIPGSGGGYNQNSIQLTSNSSLLSLKSGDTKFRSNANWTFPMLPDIDMWMGLAYIERLDFTAFFNYGGTWYNQLVPEGTFVDQNSLIAAHGYNFDLQLDNKGVRFNLGAGIGQVIGAPFEIYLKTGFDALF